MTAVLDTALAYLHGGLSVLPVLANGSKSPALDTWDELKTRRPTDSELAEWFVPGGQVVGLAVIGGRVSGQLAVLDFEYADLWDEFAGPAAAILGSELLASLPLVRTPGKKPEGGRHLYIRTAGEPIATSKLARFTGDEAERRCGDRNAITAIEVKGEGGYVLAPGCPAACHPSGREYEHLSGAPLTAVPLLTAEQAEALLSVARSCDRRGRDTAATTIRQPTPGSGARPGDEFNQRASWGDILPAHGWSCVFGRERAAYWRRPGKSAGISATTGFCSNDHAGELLYVFSSNAAPFEDGRAYSKFSAWALLNHGGDWSAAARALGESGWGQQHSGERAGVILGLNGVATLAATTGAAPVVPPPADPFTFRNPVPISALQIITEAKRWLWAGYLARGTITLLSALWKAGKTTLLSYLLKALESDGAFCGRPCHGCKTLVITEEHESLWAMRRDQIGLTDCTYVLSRPFPARPDVRRWQEFANHLREFRQRWHYDLLVMDPLSNLWPVKDENDAAGVQNALLPLHTIGDDLASLLIHHLRKGDGAEATGSRGSGALTAFCDTLLELRRYDAANRQDCRRVLTGYGRFEETPAEVVVEWSRDGYIGCGDRHEAGLRGLEDAIEAVLMIGPPGHTREQILDRLKEEDERCTPGITRVTLALHSGANAGRWIEVGTGVKGKPHRYYFASDCATGTDEPVSF